jgi:hypothetical protein
MCLTTSTITKCNGTNNAQWATETGLLLEQEQVYGIIEVFNDKPEEPAANVTAKEKAPFKNWMKHHGVARSTILLGMEQRIQAEYNVVEDAKTLWEKLASAYKSKLKLNIFEIREDHWSIKLQDCGDVDNYALRIDRKVKYDNLCAGPIAPSTAGTDAADTDTDSATSIAKMSEQEHIFYLLCGIPRNDKWKVFLELMMGKNATMTATANEIVTKLVEKEAAIKKQNGHALEALLFAKTGGKGSSGGYADQAGKVSRSQKSDKRDDKRDNRGDNDRKEKEFRKRFHCHPRGHTTDNCLHQQPGDSPTAAKTGVKASPETTSTLITSIKNYWMVGITYTEYSPNTNKVKGHNWVTSFASGYGSVRLICQLPDGKMETIIVQEVVHLPRSVNLILQSQIVDKDVKVELVNDYSLNLYNQHGKLIATAPQFDGLDVLDCILDRALGSPEYTEIDGSCLLALKTTRHASRHNAEKLMVWHRRLAHIGPKALEMLWTITDAPKIPGKSDRVSCIKSKSSGKPFTPNTTSQATKPLQLVHSDICGPLATAIGGG